MSVEVTRDTATPTLARIYDQAGPRRVSLMRVLGKEAEKQLRSWFRLRNESARNKQGFPRSNFWSKRIARATAYDSARTNADRAVVVISDPAINPHVYGGVIRPKEARMLAIPMRADVYGVRPSAKTIPGLFVQKSKDGSGAFLAAPDPDDKRFTIRYWRLKASVTIPKDPRALPPSATMGAALEKRAFAFFFRPLKGGAS